MRAHNSYIDALFPDEINDTRARIRFAALAMVSFGSRLDYFANHNLVELHATTSSSCCLPRISRMRR
jgi:hypothetical protein